VEGEPPLLDYLYEYYIYENRGVTLHPPPFQIIIIIIIIIIIFYYYYYVYSIIRPLYMTNTDLPTLFKIYRPFFKIIKLFKHTS